MSIMKKISLLLFLVATPLMHALYAQVLTNKGGSITVKNGATLTVNGNFRNLDDGNVDNSGDIYITGHWSNNATSGNLLQGTTGNVHFKGAGNQVIGGIARTWFNGLHLLSDVSLNVETSVSYGLLLSGASLDVNGQLLIMQSGSTLLGANASNYIIAENNGRLVREVGNSEVTFPIGTHTSFVPVTLKNDGTQDYYGVNVFDDVLDNGASGATIVEIDNCVQMTWDIMELVAGGSDLTITPQWNASDEGTAFDRNQCGIGYFASASWSPQIAAPASGFGPYSLSRSGIINPSAFAIGDVFSPLAYNPGIELGIKVYLEGPFNGANMNTNLNSSSLIPLTQPYNTLPWIYNGAEYVASIPNNFVVDWVLVELRDAPDAGSATGATIVAQQAAFLLRNGFVVSTDGQSTLQFNNINIQQSLFAVVWHRNSIGVMSAAALVESGGIYAYDFTTGAGQAYGGSNAHKQIAPGIWGMTGADGNADGQINNGDKNDIWALQAGTGGYKSGDYNLDAQVNNGDKNDVWVPNTGLGGQVPDLSAGASAKADKPDIDYKCQVPE